MNRERRQGPRDELGRVLASELRGLAQSGMRRVLDDLEEATAAGLADFVSNDYLSLAKDARVVDAAIASSREHGAGSRAARLLGGGRDLHATLERTVAEWLGAEAALFFPSGYHANVGIIAALAGRGDAVISDALNHASIIDGCRLSRARVEVFRHADVEDLRRALRAARGSHRTIVVTESVFGMDGDLAPLEAMHAACVEEGALLLVDEAHAIGLLGVDGAGAWFGIRDDRALLGRIVTGGKALGVAGGFFVGDALVRDVLVQRARSFVFTTAAPPAIAGALLASIAIVRNASSARARVLELARRIEDALFCRSGVPPLSGACEEARRGEACLALVPRPRVTDRSAGEGDAGVAPTNDASHFLSGDVPPLLGAREEKRQDAASTEERAAAILPIVLGDPDSALAASRACREAGLDVRAVRPPTVPEGTSRLRVAVHAHNTDEEVERLIATLRPIVEAARATSRSVPVSRRDAIFVVGTDTGVGKTVAAALIARAIKAVAPVRYWKPVQTGDESDTATVRSIAELEPGETFEPLHHFPLPASPHEAAAAAGAEIDPAALDAALDRAVASTPSSGRIVVELAGGLLVPYRLDFSQSDWLARRAPAFVLVGRSGLGTLNHTRLTLEALGARSLQPRAVLLVGDRHPSNVATLRALHPDLRFFELPLLSPLDGPALDRWIDANPAFLETLR